MKKLTVRLACAIFAVIMLIPAIAACSPTASGDITTETPEPTGTYGTVSETVPETDPIPKSYLTINASNAASVDLVRSDDLPKLSMELTVFNAFRNEIDKRFSASFGISTDKASSGQPSDDSMEILVGETVREVSIALNEKIKSLANPAFGILVSGNKIAVSGTSPYLIYRGLDHLLEKLTSTDEAGDLQIKLEDGFEYIEKNEYDYPDPEEVINSGREYAFYSIEKLASVPTQGTYSVLEGGGSDGKYAYYAMISKSTKPEKAIIYKYDMATWELVATSKSLPTAHTNDITYDSVNHRLVISYCANAEGTVMSANGIVFVNPDDLSFIEYIDCPTLNRALCYLPATNQYILAAGYTFYLTDDKFNTLSSFTCGYPQLTTQGLYSDGKYIYDPRWKSGSRYQTITINTVDGKFIAAVPFYNIEGEPENIFRDGNSFVMGCNSSDAVFRIALLYKNWWE